MTLEEQIAELSAKFDAMVEMVGTDIVRLELLAGQNQKHFDAVAEDVRRLETIIDGGADRGLVDRVAWLEENG